MPPEQPEDDFSDDEALLANMGLPVASPQRPAIFKAFATNKAPKGDVDDLPLDAAAAPSVGALEDAAPANVPLEPATLVSSENAPSLPPPAAPSSDTQTYAARDTQTYASFRSLLGLPPGGQPEPIDLPEVDPMHVISGAMLMEAQRRREAGVKPSDATETAVRGSGGDGGPATCGAAPPAKVATAALRRGALKEPSAAEEEGDGLGDGLDEIELAPGGSRDVTKSPQHHRLKMDNFVDGDDDDDDVEDVEEVEGEWVDVGQESTGSSPQGPPPPPAERGDAAAPSAAAMSTGSSGPVASPAQTGEVTLATGGGGGDGRSGSGGGDGEGGGEGGGDAVSPFRIDPSFDYDAVPITQRFSVERALVEGEYYDRLLQEATSPTVRVARSSDSGSGAPPPRPRPRAEPAEELAEVS